VTYLVILAFYKPFTEISFSVEHYNLIQTLTKQSFVATKTKWKSRMRERMCVEENREEKKTLKNK
jgi:hypothetical protein